MMMMIMMMMMMMINYTNDSLFVWMFMMPGLSFLTYFNFITFLVLVWKSLVLLNWIRSHQCSFYKEQFGSYMPPW
jgi:hypothetical protein